MGLWVLRCFSGDAVKGGPSFSREARESRVLPPSYKHRSHGAGTTVIRRGIPAAPVRAAGMTVRGNSRVKNRRF